MKCGSVIPKYCSWMCVCAFKAGVSHKIPTLHNLISECSDSIGNVKDNPLVQSLHFDLDASCDGFFRYQSDLPLKSRRLGDGSVATVLQPTNGRENCPQVLLCPNRLPITENLQKTRIVVGNPNTHFNAMPFRKFLNRNATAPENCHAISPVERDGRNYTFRCSVP